MRRRAEDEDQDDEGWDEEDDETWDAAEDDDDEPTIPCPYCQRPIHEDAQRCPYCEQYVSAEDAPPGRKPWWIILGTIVCLYIVFRWVVG